VVATNVVDLGLLDERPDVGLLQMLNLVLVGSGEVGAHAAVVASDHNTALASRLDLVDAVLGVDAGLVAGILEDIGILVLTDTADVHDGVIGQHVLHGDRGLARFGFCIAERQYLGATGSVLSGTTSNQLGVMVLEQFLVDAHVLVLGEDSIVVLQAILLQEGGVTG
jgi:hypothetical protein